MKLKEDLIQHDQILIKIFSFFLIIIASTKADGIRSQCPPTKTSIQTLLDKAYIPGAAIVVVDANKIIYEQGIGYCSPPILEQRQLIDPSSSIFILASISKTFIAVAAIQMVELNLLNLDRDINEYLPPSMKIIHPYYPNARITTRHLLSHTSAIGMNFVEELKHYLPGDGFTQTDLGDAIQKYLRDGP